MKPLRKKNGSSFFYMKNRAIRSFKSSELNTSEAHKRYNIIDTVHVWCEQL